MDLSVLTQLTSALPENVSLGYQYLSGAVT